MMKIKIKKLERIMGKKIKRNKKVMGVDTASRTGWAIIATNREYLTIDTGIVDLRSIKDKNERYNLIIKFFDGIIKGDADLVIEESYLGFNPKTFQLLSRLGGIIYTIGRYKDIDNITFITASSARKRVGIVGKQKKKEGAIKFVHKFMPNLKSEDVSDGVILALTGLVIEPKLDDYIKKGG